LIGVLEQLITARFEIPFSCDVGEVSATMNTNILSDKSTFGRGIQKFSSLKPKYKDPEMDSLEIIHTANPLHTLGVLTPYKD